MKRQRGIISSAEAVVLGICVIIVLLLIFN